MEVCRHERNIYPGTNIVAMIRERVRGDVQSTSLRALLDLEKAMFSQGAYISPEFKDQATTVAISRLGGWEHLCLMDLDEWKFVRKEFERIHQDLTKNGLPEEIPRLIGTLERSAGILGSGGQEKMAKIGGAVKKMMLTGGEDGGSDAEKPSGEI